MRLERRRFPQLWDIEERNASCFIVMDANRASWSAMSTLIPSPARSGGPDDSRRGASDRANIAKLQQLVKRLQ